MRVCHIHELEVRQWDGPAVLQRLICWAVVIVRLARIKDSGAGIVLGLDPLAAR
jgi:hypothetical protein